MSKRLKILLIVFGALLVLGGGSAVFFIMTADAPEPVPPVNVAKKMPDETADVKKPAKPAPKKPPEGGEVGTPVVLDNQTAMTQPAKDVAKPAAKDDAKPAAQPAAIEAPAKAQELPEAKPEPKCVQVISITKDKKTMEFGTADEFMSNSGMEPDEMRTFSDRFLEEKKKALLAVKGKKGVAQEDVKCAEDGVKLAEGLNTAVTEKYPEKPKKVVYSYFELDKRDPFMNPFQIPKKVVIIPDNAPPIQRQPAETLKIKGIMWTDKGYRALMLTEDGRGYTVKVGDLAGNKGGQITEITKNKIIITEKILDIFDNTEVRITPIQLNK